MNETGEGIRVRSVSPDGTVTARYASGRHVEVSYAPKPRVEHDDRRLAEQVRLAIKGVIAGYRKARGHAPEPAPAAEPGEPGEPGESGEPSLGRQIAIERRRRADAARAGISVTRTSPRGHVTIVLHAAADPEVRIRSRSLENRGPDQVFAEINTALNQALSEYRRRSLAVHKEFYVDLTASQLKEYVLERRNRP